MSGCDALLTGYGASMALSGCDASAALSLCDGSAALSGCDVSAALSGCDASAALSGCAASGAACTKQVDRHTVETDVSCACDPTQSKSQRGANLIFDNLVWANLARDGANRRGK